MRITFVLCFVFALLQSLSAQHKTEKPSTYRAVCFFTIDKSKMADFELMQERLRQKNYRALLPDLAEMERYLKNFDAAKTDRTFELWYLANYTDFDKQVEVARKSTLASLQQYKKRILAAKSLYFDHRQFLMQFLAFRTEVFYPEYWFMSQERYFSNNCHQRILQDNTNGDKIFTYSDFYKAHPAFDTLLARELNEMKQYLGIDEQQNDTSGIGKKPLIPYTYAVLDENAAEQILKTFKLDDATMDINTDREVRALRRFLQRVKAGEILLLARFEGLPFKD